MAATKSSTARVVVIGRERTKEIEGEEEGDPECPEEGYAEHRRRSLRRGEEEVQLVFTNENSHQDAGLKRVKADVKYGKID